VDTASALGFCAVKLLFIVVQREDLVPLLDALTAAQFRATAMGGRGGLLRVGSVTVLVGVDGTLVPEVFAIVKRVCRRRVRTAFPLTIEPGVLSLPHTVGVEIGGAVAFVLKVARFVRIQGVTTEPMRASRMPHVGRR
jgi:uncharacterized protein YaaQ